MTTLDDLASNVVSISDHATDESWAHDGIVRLHGLVPGDAIDAYCERFQHDAVRRACDIHHYGVELQHGYGIGTPYLQVPELRDVALHRRLTSALDDLFGEPVGMHLNLTGWRSTQRAWHQDQYLNPPCVGDGYVAAWVALDDVHPDAGPFEFVPGSHRWPSVDQAKMLAAMGEDGSDPDWPWRSESILGPLFNREIINRGGHVERFVAKKGDVLLWHSNLCHRGSVPVDPSLERRALIVHYSVVSRRCDMRGRARVWENDVAKGWYFDL